LTFTKLAIYTASIVKSNKPLHNLDHY